MYSACIGHELKKLKVQKKGIKTITNIKKKNTQDKEREKSCTGIQKMCQQLLLLMYTYLCVYLLHATVTTTCNTTTTTNFTT